jgi:peptidoglycan-associated lipoprotein
MTASLRATTIYALIITSILVGCARRPAPTAMTAPAPTAVTAERSAEPAAATAPRAEERIVTRQEEISVARRPDPATFAENDNVKTIYFDFDRYDIRPGDAKTLEADAAWLKTHDVLILIEGQCDERGTVEYNLALGDRRARAAMNHLVALGIAADRISTVSYGKERPVCDAHDESCWALNRRAHIVVKSRG